MIEDLDTDGHLLKAITSACDGRIVQMPAPMSLPGVFPPGVTNSPFKMVKLKGNEELLLTGARLGKRNPIILHLEPMDTVEYANLELESGKLAQFPELEHHLVTSLGTYLSRLQDEADVDTLNAGFIPSGKSLNAAISTFRAEVNLAFIESLKAVQAAKRAKEAELAYADSDAWGTW